jgi:hypothetical protein
MLNNEKFCGYILHWFTHHIDLFVHVGYPCSLSWIHYLHNFFYLNFVLSPLMWRDIYILPEHYIISVYHSVTWLAAQETAAVHVSVCPSARLSVFASHLMLITYGCKYICARLQRVGECILLHVSKQTKRRLCVVMRVKVPIHVRVWFAVRLGELDSGARLGYIHIIGQRPARDTSHTDEFDSLEPEPSRTR